MPKVDPLPGSVALTAIDLKRVQRLQTEKGRDSRLRLLTRRNRDVAWPIGEHKCAILTKPKKGKGAEPS